MYKKLIIVLSCVFTVINMQASLKSEVIGQDSTIDLNSYELVWQDEFDGNSVNLAKWNYRAVGTVRNYATVSRNTVSLDGQGHCVIQVTQDASGIYYVGELGTQGIYSTTYGYFECKARMNKSLGPHIAFWLQSPTISTVGDPAVNGTEIDIFEYHRKTPGTIYQTIHWDGYGTYHQFISKTITDAAVDTGFHTFGLLWTADKYTFYIDGKKTSEITTAVSQRSEYLILSTELTGWGGTPSLGTYPDSVVYDYVRVYKERSTGVQVNQSPDWIKFNVTSDNINLTLDDQISSSTMVDIYDITGKKCINKSFLANEKMINIPVGNLEKGIYLCKIIQGIKSKTFKFKR